MTCLNARSAPSFVSSAPCLRATSMKRFDCAGSSGLRFGLCDMSPLYPSSFLSQPHARRVAVDKFNTRLFQRALNLADRVRVSAGSPGFQPGNRHRRDLGQARQFTDAQSQRGAGHADLVACDHGYTDLLILYQVGDWIHGIRFGHRGIRHVARPPGVTREPARGRSNRRSGEFRSGAAVDRAWLERAGLRWRRSRGQRFGNLQAARCTQIASYTRLASVLGLKSCAPLITPREENHDR